MADDAKYDRPWAALVDPDEPCPWCDQTYYDCQMSGCRDCPGPVSASQDLGDGSVGEPGGLGDGAER